jgi:hypothetical protein
MLKDQFTFSSLLAIGAILNFLLYLAIGQHAFFLAPLLLLVRIVDAVLQTYNLRHNPHMDHVISGLKMSAQYPSADGSFGSKPASEQIVVFMIGARNNHPMGLLAPGWKELGDYFASMTKELGESNMALEYGFLGSQHWVADGQRATNNEVMAVMFFKTSEGLHNYAHGGLHRRAWNWWNKTEVKHPHIGIWHEMFVSPKGHWESIYINSQPLGLGAVAFPIKTETGTVWQSPLVDASTGVLRSSKGRMMLGDGKDHEEYGADDPYNRRR